MNLIQGHSDTKCRGPESNHQPLTPLPAVISAIVSGHTDATHPTDRMEPPTTETHTIHSNYEGDKASLRILITANNSLVKFVFSENRTF